MPRRVEGVNCTFGEGQQKQRSLAAARSPSPQDSSVVAPRRNETGELKFVKLRCRAWVIAAQSKHPSSATPRAAHEHFQRDVRQPPRHRRDGQKNSERQPSRHRAGQLEALERWLQLTAELPAVAGPRRHRLDASPAATPSASSSVRVARRRAELRPLVAAAEMMGRFLRAPSRPSVSASNSPTPSPNRRRRSGPRRRPTSKAWSRRGMDLRTLV